jgi:hypothetical protein
MVVSPPQASHTHTYEKPTTKATHTAHHCLKIIISVTLHCQNEFLFTFGKLVQAKNERNFPNSHNCKDKLKILILLSRVFYRLPLLSVVTKLFDGKITDDIVKISARECCEQAVVPATPSLPLCRNTKSVRSTSLSLEFGPNLIK